MMRRAALLAALVVGLACREPVEAERTGDRAYAAGDFAAAQAAYTQAAGQGGGADLLARLGLAALRNDDPAAALAAYRQLAADAPARAGEAAEGIAAAARMAAARRDAETLRAAVTALQTLEPERRVGRWALDLARRGMLGDRDLVGLAAEAVAAAPDAESGDSVVLAWAEALVRAGDCAAAGSLYRGVARRSRDEALAEPARAGASACALAVGRRALEARDTAAALDALGSVVRWADSDRGAATAAELVSEIRAARERLAPMDTTFLMNDLEGLDDR